MSGNVPYDMFQMKTQISLPKKSLVLGYAQSTQQTLMRLLGGQVLGTCIDLLQSSVTKYIYIYIYIYIFFFFPDNSV